MEDIELAVKIPEEAYKLLQNEGVDWLGAEHILNAVANGTPLPKGCDIQRIIPKRVNVQKWIYTECPNPNCNRELSTHYGDGYYSIEYKPDFCPNCGQALLWESEE